MSETLKHPFDPIIFNNTHTLILGSFPSIKSFDNHFWKIMEAVTGYPVNNRDQKIWLLKESGFGLWDMIAACRRENSLDSSLEEEEVNDIPALLEQYPSIKKLAFTGKKAEALFETYFAHLDIERVYLPSPSAAYAAMALQEKIAIYNEKLGMSNA